VHLDQPQPLLLPIKQQVQAVLGQAQRQVASRLARRHGTALRVEVKDGVGPA
jgi:hypothetical protein